jgi:hypothetical protein
MKCFAAFMEELLKGILLGDFQCDLLDQLDTFQQGDLCDWNARKCKKLFIKAEAIDKKCDYCAIQKWDEIWN